MDNPKTFDNPLVNKQFIRNLKDRSATIWRGTDPISGLVVYYLRLLTSRSNGCCFVPRVDLDSTVTAGKAAFVELNSPEIKGRCLKLAELQRLVANKGEPIPSNDPRRSDYWTVDLADLGLAPQGWEGIDADPVFDAELRTEEEPTPLVQTSTGTPLLEFSKIREADSRAVWHLTEAGKERLGFSPSYGGNPTLNVLIDQARKNRLKVLIDADGNLVVA